MNAFREHHKGSIQFGYRCFDRLLLNGLIQPFQQPERVLGFFNHYREGQRVSRNLLTGIADRFQHRLTNRAGKWGAPVVEAPEETRRDGFVQPYLRNCEPDRVAVILKAREPARILIAIGSEKNQSPHLEMKQRWVNQFNFYLNDKRWGRMFVRICPYSVFSRGLSEPASLAGDSDARRKHRFSAEHERIPEVRESRAAAGTGRFADGPESAAMWPEVAGRIHAFLHRQGAKTGWL